MPSGMPSGMTELGVKSGSRAKTYLVNPRNSRFVKKSLLTNTGRDVFEWRVDRCERLELRDFWFIFPRTGTLLNLGDRVGGVFLSLIDGRSQ